MSCEHLSTSVWRETFLGNLLGRQRPPVFTLLIWSCLSLSPKSLLGFCIQHFNETAVLKSANHFQVGKLPNHFLVLPLLDFSKEFHQVDPPSFLKHLITSLCWHHISLCFLPTHWLLVNHLCCSSSLVKCLNVHCPLLDFQTFFSSLSTDSPWWSHPVTWLSNHLMPMTNQIYMHWTLSLSIHVIFPCKGPISISNKIQLTSGPVFPISLNGTTTHPVIQAKYLGIILNFSLSSFLIYQQTC